MTVNTVILFTILASFVVFSHAQAGTANHLDYSQYTGEWKMMGIATNDSQMSNRDFGWINITRMGTPADSYKFVINIRSSIEGDWESCWSWVLARILISQRVALAPLNAGSEMLFTERSGTPSEYTLLLSHDSKPSDAGKKALEQYAEQHNLVYKIFDLTRAPYGNNSQDAYNCGL